MEKCLYCEEPITPNEMARAQEKIYIDDDRRASQRLVHYECNARTIYGSVGHQLGECSCRGGTGTMGDPPGMTKREAAAAALIYHHTRRWEPQTEE